MYRQRFVAFKAAKTAPLFKYLEIYFLIFCKSLISFEKRRELNLL
jgi:hypothetical protein